MLGVLGVDGVLGVPVPGVTCSEKVFDAGAPSNDCAIIVNEYVPAFAGVPEIVAVAPVLLARLRFAGSDEPSAKLQITASVVLNAILVL